MSPYPGPPPEAAVAGARTVFRQHNNTEQRAQVGTTAVLHCVAPDLGDTTDWQLHIRYVQIRDDGVYECQVASHPPTSLLSTLHVHEATSEILGGPEKYVTVGSSLRLVCVLRDNTQPPSYVFWYHGHQMINYHTTRQVRVENSEGLSVLFLSNVRPGDSGNYTCAPSNTRPAHIIIHVLKGGETPAAIHSGTGSSGAPLPLLLLLLLLLLALLPFSTHLPSTTFTLAAKGKRRCCRIVSGDDGGSEGIGLTTTTVTTPFLATSTPGEGDCNGAQFYNNAMSHSRLEEGWAAVYKA
ncbi:hypothetical protein Pmani_031527 [Petrolisthes manimaculis]|uniref:Ig-like domain-containing protein n=1 Tax=Petrolisthes manimaculis TaxID=1843537 RepID=A0AAE1TUS2_9EUCA|nr:hypothetical protein Pmani_031527 [Petrolisthes manimaculis]